MTTTITARVLVFRERMRDGTAWYVAQVLEYDLATQARTIGELVDEIDRLILAHVACCKEEGVDPFSSLPAAPKEYVAGYETSGIRIVRVQRIDIIQHPMLDLDIRLSTEL